MKEVFALVEEKKQEFAKLPLFQFMQDKNIDPRQRLAWAPCAAPFIMSFGDLNKYIFREEPSDDPIQVIINKHTYEDDHHWLWFLEDIQRLGLDKTLRFSDTLRFLWDEETKAARALNYQLYRYALQATPIQKLIIVEVTEATGNVMFSVAAKIGQEIQAITQKDFLYFADFHLAVETGHAIGLPDIEECIADINLTYEARTDAFELVEKVFEAFTQMTHSFLNYSKKYELEQLSEVA
jgi:hypothetical protein